jgi:hypothetical protein
VNYKPNFCCNCGEKIDRVDWSFTNSRRFCDVCQTDFFVQDWLPTAFVCVMTVVGLFGIGTYMKAATATAPAAFTKPPPPRVANRNSNSAANQSVLNVNRESTANRPIATRQIQDEPVGICGATTKKGTSCTRRVKGGGRCWQHKDQPPATGNSKTRAAPK